MNTATTTPSDPTEPATIDPVGMIRPRRKVTGMSAILLPVVDGGGDVDWDGFDAHVERTFAAGLTPAINMDTGFAHLIDEPTRLETLRRTRAIAAGRPFVAGAFVGDQPGDRLDANAYRQAMAQVTSHDGTPILFQSFGLTSLEDDEVVSAYESLTADCDRFLAFELGTVFAPFGKIYPLDVYAGLLGIDKCVGAKHSSLNRVREWERLALRDRIRPDFMVLTGNDLAIDMVMYGSDYLLGLSTFAPDAFARRDAMWASGDPEFYELNDLLQYLGTFTFRPPVPAYKHSAAMFLRLRDMIASDQTYPGSPRRPDADREVLTRIVEDLSRRVES